MRPRNAVELVITYKGLDFDKDNMIRAVLPWSDSGFLFGENLRDHTAEVDPKKLSGVIRKLKKIRGIKIKRLVKKWVLVR